MVSQGGRFRACTSATEYFGIDKGTSLIKLDSTEVKRLFCVEMKSFAG